MKTILLVTAVATPAVAFMVLLMMYVDGQVGAGALGLALFAVFAVSATAIFLHDPTMLDADSPPTDLR